MKRLLILIPLFASIQFSYAIGHYEEGSTLYVWAYHGLTCRAEPTASGVKVAVVPYGAQITVVKKDARLTHQVAEFGGFVMRGIWVKVSFQGSAEGYVFDGYLSTYPARETQAKNDWFEESLPYLESIFGASKRTVLGQQPNGAACSWKSKIYTFKNGAVAAQTCGEGGFIQTMEIPGFSFEEAYLLLFLNHKISLDEKLKRNKSLPVLEISEQNRKTVRMHCEMTDYIFEKKRESVFIKFWSSC